MSGKPSTLGIVSLALVFGIGAGVVGRELLSSRTSDAGLPATTVDAPVEPVTAAADNVPQPQRPPSVPAAVGERGPLGPGQRAGAPSIEDVKRELENRLLAEDVSPSWARFNEEQVESLLDPAQLSAEGLEPPLFHAVECRSSLCRVDLLASDQDAMEMTQLRVIQGIAGSLGTAQLFYEPNLDGTVKLVIYASATPR